MEKVIETGKTLEEVVEKALGILMVKRDQVEYTVLEEGKEGILGLGSKPYKVEVRIVTLELPEKARRFVDEVIELMGLSGISQVVEKEDCLYVNVETDDGGILIGHHGETLKALQYLLNIVMGEDLQKKKPILLNINDYQAKREKMLHNMVSKAAQKVLVSGRSFKLEPMEPHERKLVHQMTEDYPQLTSRSEGNDPFRRVVILPRKGSQEE